MCSDPRCEAAPRWRYASSTTQRGVLSGDRLGEQDAVAPAAIAETRRTLHERNPTATDMPDERCAMCATPVGPLITQRWAGSNSSRSCCQRSRRRVTCVSQMAHERTDWAGQQWTAFGGLARTSDRSGPLETVCRILAVWGSGVRVPSAPPLTNRQNAEGTLGNRIANRRLTAADAVRRSAQHMCASHLCNARGPRPRIRALTGPRETRSGALGSSWRGIRHSSSCRPGASPRRVRDLGAYPECGPEPSRLHAGRRRHRQRLGVLARPMQGSALWSATEPPRPDIVHRPYRYDNQIHRWLSGE
jgi:hypothetical protein